MEAAPNLRWLMTSGAPGLSEAGELPDDITGQAELADGGMGMGQDWKRFVAFRAEIGRRVSG